MFNLKDFIEEQSEGETEWEIDLSPLLALMVTLIPVLLLQTSFATMTMLETTLPILSDAKQEQIDKKKKNEIKFDLDIFAKKENRFQMKVQVNSKVVKTVDINSLEGNFDLKGLYKELAKLKSQYPKQIGAKLTPADNVKYDTIVKILDVIRRDDSGQSYKFKDDKGKMVETTMLFPDVVFGNIAE